MWESSRGEVKLGRAYGGDILRSRQTVLASSLLTRRAFLEGGMSAVVGWLVFVFIRSWKETEGAGSCILVFWGKGQGNSRMGCECLVSRYAS